MEYLVLFLLLMATLIAAYFYLERAKIRDGKRSAPSATKEPEAHTEHAAK